MVKDVQINFIDLSAAFSSLRVASVVGRVGNFLLGSAHPWSLLPTVRVGWLQSLDFPSLQ